MTGTVKGWCPGALRPMPSGDGLVVRVRPRLGRLSHVQALGLCDLGERFSGGRLELTNRGNVQLRGVQPADHAAILEQLTALNLVDENPVIESRRNILVTPFHGDGLVEEVSEILMMNLLELPDLPVKFGFAVDCGRERVLSADSADIRIERAAVGGLILRADGADSGRLVAARDLGQAILALSHWFAAHRGDARRMRAVVCALPDVWTGASPVSAAPPQAPGHRPEGMLLGVPFGDLSTHGFRRLLARNGLEEVRITPWRSIFLPNQCPFDDPLFVTRPGDPLMRVHACAGAPFCDSATVETRSLARALAGRVSGELHVSGCAKGCAHPRGAGVTLVGRDGRLDLVQGGAPWDEPARCGIDPAALMNGTEKL